MADTPLVVLVDDDPGALESMRWLIDQAGYRTCCFESAAGFLQDGMAEEPVCIVLDIRMSEVDGMDLQQKLVDQGSRVPIIFLTAHGNVPLCARAFRAGAFDFLEKPIDVKVLLQRIDDAALRRQDSPSRLLSPETQNRIATLTPREKEVMEQLGQGKTMKQIATMAGISVQTVWKHRARVLLKLGVDNDVEIARVLSGAEPIRPRKRP